MKNINVAVFDFDGTVTRYDTTKLYTILFFLRFPIRSIQYILKYKRQYGFFSTGIIKNNLKGKSIKSISLIIKLYVLLVSFTINKEILKKIENTSKLKEWKIIIATASPSFLVHPILNRLQIIAHGYKIVDGIFTGETVNSQPYGYEKLLQVNKCIESFGGKEISLAFSDSLADAPLLNNAKKAFLVKNNRIIPYIKKEYND